MDVKKKIRIRGYPQIKFTTGKKWILKVDTRYPQVRVFHVNGADMNIIVSVRWIFVPWISVPVKF